jgi:acetoin utilization protein AcuB
VRIRDVMTKDPITIAPETSIYDAQDIMRKHTIRRLPVVEKGKLVGMVIERMLLEASPSGATSLSIWELNYLLARMRVKDIMVRDPITISPDMPFEDALSLGQEKKIGAFPVVENGRVIGIATESDIIRVLTKVLGLHEEGVRINIEGLGARLGALEEVISIIERHKTIILSMLTLPRPEQGDWLVVIRVKTANADPIVADLKKVGLNVTHIS